ncbi:MAG: 30S ribosomal protein S7 [bacterium]
MARHGKTPKRTIDADSVYNSGLVQRLINKLILDGKKSKAERIVYDAFAVVKDKLKREPLEVFEKALQNLTPMLEVKARRVGGATYQIPIEVSRSRGQALALQWLRDVCRAKKGKTMTVSLAQELMDASSGTGEAIKKREDLHKTAEANKAFSHFRW